MASVQKTVDVDRPVRTVYNQWTQFEDFPRFMDGVEQVRQIDDTHLHWKARVAGTEREWDAEIVRQEPDQGVAWRSTSGTTNAGAVTFQALSPEATRVFLQLELEPEGAVEQAGDKLGFVAKQAEGDLKRFKAFIEGRPAETGAWRGRV